MKKIAITGGIGSGKSFVSSLIKEQGYPVFSCDEIYNDVIRMPTYIEKIRCIFPTAVKDEQIDRKILSDIIFRNAQKRKLLDDVAHPLIMKRLLEIMQADNAPLVFAEVPLLFEGGYENLFDGVIIVQRENNARMHAVSIRDGISLESAKLRMDAQIVYNEDNIQHYKEKRDVFVLENDSDIISLKNKLIQLLQQLL